MYAFAHCMSLHATCIHCIWAKMVLCACMQMFACKLHVCACMQLTNIFVHMWLSMRYLEIESLVIFKEEFQRYGNDVGNAFLQLQTRMILLLKNANFGHLISACIVIVVLLSYLKS